LYADGEPVEYRASFAGTRPLRLAGRVIVGPATSVASLVGPTVERRRVERPEPCPVTEGASWITERLYETMPEAREERLKRLLMILDCQGTTAEVVAQVGWVVTQRGKTLGWWP
jgi:hypothetical protein